MTSRTIKIAKLSDLQPDVLTVIYRGEIVTLDPSIPWTAFQPARLRAETLIDRVTDAHDAMRSCGDAFEFSDAVYGDVKT